MAKIRAQMREKHMSLGAHLVELRRRLLISAIGILLGMVVGFLVSPFAVAAMSAPVLAIADERGAALLNFTSVTGAFDLRMRVAVTIGIVISSPIWLLQVWGFLVPAFTRRETRFTISFLGTAVPLFLLGCVAGWFVLPNIVALMLGFTPGAASNFLDANIYFDFVLKLTLAVGTAFIMPVFLVLLNAIGVLPARSIIRGWRFAVLGIVLFTALATPAADVVSMLILALPMLCLYFAAYGAAALHDYRGSRKAARAEAAERSGIPATGKSQPQ